MSGYEQVAESAAAPAVAERRGPRRFRLGDTWWRHLVGLLAVGFSLFPVAYIVSAAFNTDPTLSGASLIPRRVTLDNFRELFATQAEAESTFSAANYARWFVNTLIVCSTAAVLMVLLSALAAYAFSRFRFRGAGSGCWRRCRSRCSLAAPRRRDLPDPAAHGEGLPSDRLSTR